MLDGIEKAGNKVPHPVIMFLYLIAFIAVLSAVLAAFDVERHRGRRRSGADPGVP